MHAGYTNLPGGKNVAEVLHLLTSVNNTCSPTAFSQETQMTCVYFTSSHDLSYYRYLPYVLPMREEKSRIERGSPVSNVLMDLF